MCRLLRLFCFFFFKQKTAYEMRISDWSSDVCSSDLDVVNSIILSLNSPCAGEAFGIGSGIPTTVLTVAQTLVATYGIDVPIREIGRASCRERGCQDV